MAFVFLHLSTFLYFTENSSFFQILYFAPNDGLATGLVASCKLQLDAKDRKLFVAFYA